MFTDPLRTIAEPEVTDLCLTCFLQILTRAPFNTCLELLKQKSNLAKYLCQVSVSPSFTNGRILNQSTRSSRKGMAALAQAHGPRVHWEVCEWLIVGDDNSKELASTSLKCHPSNNHAKASPKQPPIWVQHANWPASLEEEGVISDVNEIF